MYCLVSLPMLDPWKWEQNNKLRHKSTKCLLLFWQSTYLWSILINDWGMLPCLIRWFLFVQRSVNSEWSVHGKQDILWNLFYVSCTVLRFHLKTKWSSMSGIGEAKNYQTLLLLSDLLNSWILNNFQPLNNHLGSSNATAKYPLNSHSYTHSHFSSWEVFRPVRVYARRTWLSSFHIRLSIVCRPLLGIWNDCGRCTRSVCTSCVPYSCEICILSIEELWCFQHTWQKCWNLERKFQN